MYDEILAIADMYAEGLTRVQKRREQWMEQYEMLRDHLTDMAKYLNEHARYKQGFYVDTLHAFNEDIKGTSSRMPSITFRSGEMPMMVTFRNAMGEKKNFAEEGFSISFNPTITGQIVVMLEPHYSDLDKEMPEPINLAIVEEPGLITTAVADEIITRGMKIAHYSSFTGMGQIPDDAEQVENAITKRNPIGFRRHDTTEKVEQIHAAANTGNPPGDGMQGQ